jgi:acetyl-CoA carboxylase biotin carboxyl carrier protein
MATVDAHITGTVWKILVAVGDAVPEGGEVAILESMKMEMPVEAEDGGVVAEILCSEGESVDEGQPLIRLTDA